MNLPRDWRFALAFVISLIFWGSAFAAIRLAVREYSPTHVALLRFLTASGVLLACAPFMRVRVPERRDLPGLCLMGFCGVFIYHTFLNWGAQTVTAGAAAFLIHTAPVFTAIIAGLFLSERLSPRQALGMVISLCGAALIAMGEESGFSFSVGALLILVAAVSSAVYITTQRFYLARYRPFEITSYGIWLGTLMLMVFSPGLVSQMSTASPAATVAIIYMGIFPGAIAYFMWSVVIQKTNATTAASMLYVVPVISIVIAWLWFSETPSTLSFAGGVVALLGVAVVNLRRRVPVPIEN